MTSKKLVASHKEQRLLQNKIRLIKELEESIKEVKLIIQGKKRGRSLSRLIIELKD